MESYEQGHKLEAGAKGTIVEVGSDDWPFPIPLVEHEGRWHFDTPAGEHSWALASGRTRVTDVASQPPTLSLTDGGPGAAILRRLHFGPWDFGAASPRTAVVLIAITWPPLFLLSWLMQLKQRAQLEYGTLASQYTQLFHRKWIQEAGAGDESILDSADIQSLADLSTSHELVHKMRSYRPSCRTSHASPSRRWCPSSR